MALFMMGGPACAHHWRSGSVSVAEPEPSANAGADSTAKTAETVGWKEVDVGSRSENKEGRRGVTSLYNGVRRPWRREGWRMRTCWADLVSMLPGTSKQIVTDAVWEGPSTG